MTFRQKPIRQMRAEKTRTSGDDRNRLRIFGHRGVVLIAAVQVYQQEVKRIALYARCPQRIPRVEQVALRTVHPTAFVLRH